MVTRSHRPAGEHTPRRTGLTSVSSPHPTPSPEVPQDSGDNYDDDDADPADPLAPPELAPPTTQQLRRVVHHFKAQGDVENTRKAYDPKEKEYFAFCNHAYKEVDETERYIVDFDRLYRFLFYQAFRSKRSGKGKSRSSTQTGFIPSEYDSILLILAQYGRDIDIAQASHAPIPELPFPEDAVGYSTLNTYRSTVRGIYEIQVENGDNTLLWDSQIHLKSVRNLFAIVSERNKVMKKLQHAEKIDSEDSPFQNFQEVPVIAREYLLQGIGATCRTIFTSLRNRFAFLSNFASILRNESQHLADLSDTRCFMIQREDDHDPILIKLMKIATGKTVKRDGPSQFGRAIRHKDVFMCSRRW